MPFHTRVGRSSTARLELPRNWVSFLVTKSMKTGCLQLYSKCSSTAIYLVSQIPNKSLKEPKATNSVGDNNPDRMKQAASKKGISMSLWERHIVIHHCMLGRMKNNRFSKLKNTAKNWMATVWGVILWTSFSVELGSGDQSFLLSSEIWSVLVLIVNIA